ncbi:MAG TPA: glycosyltransferase family 2 protein [Bacteroidales bacterium]|nr:glycosyltransferase family 2 protein [Bacteroidales bacterium]
MATEKDDLTGGIRSAGKDSASRFGPLVSVITVVYNAADTIEDTIKSVLSQSYENIEYIIIDGGSTDGTADIISRYGDLISCRISEPDNGIYDAMNKGIRIAKGEIIHLLNADDYYIDNNLIRKVVDSFGNNSLAACHTKIVYGNGNIAIRKVVADTKLFLDTPFMHPSLFVKKNIYEEIGCFDLNYKYAGDVDFIFRALVKGNSYSTLDCTGVLMRAGGLSDSNFLKAKREYYKSYIRNFHSPVRGVAGYFYIVMVFIYLKIKKIFVR